MTPQLDEKQWPELTKFRDACLFDDYAQMLKIASRNHHWYANENPECLPMEKLASIFKAQWYSQVNDLDSLKRIVELHPWTVNTPWTAQGWLPITQAASTHGSRQIIEYLIEQGADLGLTVGEPDDRASIVQMAQYGNNPELAEWLQQLVDDINQ